MDAELRLLLREKIGKALNLQKFPPETWDRMVSEIKEVWLEAADEIINAAEEERRG